MLRHGSKQSHYLSAGFAKYNQNDATLARQVVWSGSLDLAAVYSFQESGAFLFLVFEEGA